MIITQLRNKCLSARLCIPNNRQILPIFFNRNCQREFSSREKSTPQAGVATYYNCSGFACLTFGELKLSLSSPDFFVFSNLTLPTKTSGKSPQKDLV